MQGVRYQGFFICHLINYTGYKTIYIYSLSCPYLSTLPFFSGSLPYFTPISRPPPILVFLPGDSRNLYGPNLVIWIITSIFYSKVVQLLDPVWNASPHTIDTIHISKHFVVFQVQVRMKSQSPEVTILSFIGIRGQQQTQPACHMVAHIQLFFYTFYRYQFSNP